MRNRKESLDNKPGFVEKLAKAIRCARIYRVEKLIIPVALDIQEWFYNGSTSSYVAERLCYEVQSQVEKKIAEQIQYDFDKEIIKKIADELIINYDFENAVKEAMHDKIKGYLARI